MGVWNRRPRCHFCVDAPIIPKDLFCPQCGQYNGFSEETDSGYDRELPELYTDALNPPGARVPTTQSVPTPPHGVFCARCLNNMELQRAAIATIDDDIGPEEETSQLAHLETDYAICPLCDARSKARLEVLQRAVMERLVASRVSHSVSNRARSIPRRITTCRPSSPLISIAWMKDFVALLFWSICSSSFVVLPREVFLLWLIVITVRDMIYREKAPIVVDLCAGVLIASTSMAPPLAWFVSRVFVWALFRPFVKDVFSWKRRWTERREEERAAACMEEEEEAKEVNSDHLDDDSMDLGLEPALASVRLSDPVNESLLRTVVDILKAVARYVQLVLSSKKTVLWMQWRYLSVLIFALLMVVKMMLATGSVWGIGANLAALSVLAERQSSTLMSWEKRRRREGSYTGHAFRSGGDVHQLTSTDFTAACAAVILIVVAVLGLKILCFDFIPTLLLQTEAVRTEILLWFESYIPPALLRIKKTEVIFFFLGLLWLWRTAVNTFV